MRSASTLLLLATIGCAGSAGVAGTPSPATALRPEDRVVIGDFTRVQAIASSFERVYVAFPGALGLWNPLSRRWEVPRTPPRPAMLQDVRVAMIDPSDQSLWLATGTRWLHYAPMADRWSEGPLPGPPTAIGVDPMDALGAAWFRVGGRWYRQSRIGGVTAPAAPSSSLRIAPTIEDALRDLPQLRALAPRLLTGPGLEQGRLTGAVPLSDGTAWLLGTTTLGVLRLDRMGVEATPMPHGLRGSMVGALALLPDGIWVATDAERRTTGDLAFLSSDLAETRPIEGRAPFGLPFAAARALLPGDRALWLATDQGVVRYGLDDQRVARFGATEGLPDPRVLALTHYQRRVVAATMRGLVEITPDGEVEPIAQGFLEPAYDLLARGDTLWVGTARGLRAWLPGEEGLAEPEGLRILPGSRVPIRGVAYVADTLVAMTEQQLLWRDPVTGAWSWGPLLGGLGRLVRLTATPSGLWIAGDGGAGYLTPTTPLLRQLRVGIDLPEAVTAIAASREWLWVGTGAGLVRIRLLGG